MRSCSVSTVSPGRTGTDCWASTGPASISRVAMWTVVPVSVTPASRASATACHPGNAGSSAGWVLRILPPKAVWIDWPSTVPNPAITTTSMSASDRTPVIDRVYRSRSNAGPNPPNSARSTRTAGMAASEATSIARHRRSATTSRTGRSAPMIASRMVPLPEARTAIRTDGESRGGVPGPTGARYQRHSPPMPGVVPLARAGQWQLPRERQSERRSPTGLPPVRALRRSVPLPRERPSYPFYRHGWSNSEAEISDVPAFQRTDQRFVEPEQRGQLPVAESPTRGVERLGLGNRDHPHAGSLGRERAVERVLEGQACDRVDTQFRRRRQIGPGVGLAQRLPLGGVPHRELGLDPEGPEGGLDHHRTRT